MKMPNLVFMFGTNGPDIRTEIMRWEKAFHDKHGGDLNMEKFSENFDLEQINSSVMSAPFLAEKRLVILQNYLAQSAKKTEDHKAFLKLIDSIPESSVLLIAENGDPDKRGAIYKKLIEKATLKHYEAPKGYQLTAWIKAECAKMAVEIDTNCAEKLISMLGEDLWRIKHELEKCALLAENGIIKSEILDEIVSKNPSYNIFKMTDAISQGRIAEGLKILKNLEESGEEAAFLFAMILRQFRLMLEIKELKAEGMSEHAISQNLKMHPFAVQNTSLQSQRFSKQDLKKKLKAFLDFDRKLKRGRIYLRPRENDMYLLMLERILLS